MISLADFQPLSIAKISIFHQKSDFYRKIYHSVKVHASEEVPCVRCVTAPVSVAVKSLIGLKYYISLQIS